MSQVRGEIAATGLTAVFLDKDDFDEYDARQLAWLAQIATLGMVVLMSLWLSPAVAAARSPGYPVDATIFAMRATLTRMCQVVARRHRG